MLAVSTDVKSSFGFHIYLILPDCLGNTTVQMGLYHLCYLLSYKAWKNSDCQPIITLAQEISDALFIK